MSVLGREPPLRQPGGTAGAKGARTPDLVNAIHALYQLSYDPSLFDVVAARCHRRALPSELRPHVVGAQNLGVPPRPCQNVFPVLAELFFWRLEVIR